MRNNIMKKILILTNDAKYTIDLRIEILNKLKEKKSTIYIASPKSKYSENLFEYGFTVINTDFKRRSLNIVDGFLLLIKYNKIIRQFKPDVILSFTIKPNVLGGLLVKKGIDFYPNITGLGTGIENGGFLEKIIRCLYKLSFKNSKSIFIQNNMNYEYFVRNNIHPEKLTLLPGSGINLEKFSLLKYPNDKVIRFSFISRIMKEKGIDEFLWLAKKIKSIYSEVEFHVCGFIENSYYNIINKVSEDNVIIYHGHVSDVREILQFTNCIIHPSYYPEGISNILLEAAACGRPIITTNRPGCLETVIEGVSGYLVNTKDMDALYNATIKFLELNRSEQELMGVNGRKHIVDKFDRNIVVQKYIDLIFGNN
jgi:galacturonosyltransferase